MARLMGTHLNLVSGQEYAGTCNEYAGYVTKPGFSASMLGCSQADCQFPDGHRNRLLFSPPRMVCRGEEAWLLLLVLLLFRMPLPLGLVGCLELCCGWLCPTISTCS